MLRKLIYALLLTTPLLGAPAPTQKPIKINLQSIQGIYYTKESPRTLIICSNNLFLSNWADTGQYTYKIYNIEGNCVYAYEIHNYEKFPNFVLTLDFKEFYKDLVNLRVIETSTTLDNYANVVKKTTLNVSFSRKETF